MKQNIPLLIIAGPTASGKSDLAINLAKELNGEIISCDSAQIYRYMDIGTAKPSLEERNIIKHHLIDYVYPNEEYSAVRYKEDCHNAIWDIVQRGKVPLICGGTGMYINAALYPLNFGNAYKSEEIREELALYAKNKGNAFVYKILQEIDEETAQKLHPNDLNRVIRAIEIYRVSGKKKSELLQEYKEQAQYAFYLAVLNTERECLYEKINLRTEKMIKNGLEDEVRKLLQMGYGKCKSLEAIGYKEIIEYINGNCSFDYAVSKIKQNTRNYAKRQITWFKGAKEAVWYDTERGQKHLINEIIKNYKKLW